MRPACSWSLFFGLACCLSGLGWSEETGQDQRPLGETEWLGLELVGGSELSSVVNRGATVEMVVEVVNRTTGDLALCWSSTPGARFLRHSVVDSVGKAVDLDDAGGEVHVDRFFDPARSIMVLPAASGQFVRLDLDTNKLPPTGTCSEYRVGGTYRCPPPASEHWAEHRTKHPSEDSRLVLEADSDNRLTIQVDDRPWWRRVLGTGGCGR